MKQIVTYCSIAVVLVLAAFLVFQSVKKQEREPISSGRTEREVAIPVTVSSVILHDFQDEIRTVGTLKAYEVGLLSPKVAGTVEAVLVDIGEHVREGQVVIQIDSTNFDLAVKQATAALAAAKSAVSQAKVQFEHAEKEFLRASHLLAEKVISQRHFDEAEAAYKASRDVLAAAKEGQRNQALAALQMAGQHLKDTETRSPMSGVVVERNVEIGQFVAPGAPLLRIIDPSMLKADVDLPESDLTRITTETNAVIEVDAFKGQRFSGKVVLVNPMVDRMTRTFRVRVEVPNPDEKLVDGMFARVWLTAGKRRSLAVSRDVLRRLPGSGTFYVFLVNGDRAVKRTIKTGVIGDQYAEVIEGLSEGEKVVTSGEGRLRSGTKVIVK